MLEHLDRNLVAGDVAKSVAAMCGLMFLVMPASAAIRFSSFPRFLAAS